MLTAKRPKSPKFPKTLISLGDHIKARRLELGLLQWQLAKQISVKTDTILNWEHNRTTPTLRYHPKILEFIGDKPSTDEPKTLGEKLLKYRRDRGMTQKELARRIGIDPTTLSRVERDKGECFSSTRTRVSVFLRIQMPKDSLAGFK